MITNNGQSSKLAKTDPKRWVLIKSTLNVDIDYLEVVSLPPKFAYLIVV